jgi:small subunit ribosomal protein S7
MVKKKTTVKTEKKIIKKESKPKISKKPAKKEIKPKVEVKIPITKPEPKKIIKPEPKAPAFKAFGLWETKGIQVLDQGMKRYITLDPVYVPYTQGRDIAKKFWKSDKPIIERLINKMLVSGHKGKKHWRTSGISGGKKLLMMKIVMEAFKIIEQRTKKNPVEVLVRAIEAGAPREGITTIEYGGVKYPKAVDISPQRRIDLTLRWIVQGAYGAAASGKTVKKKIHMALAEQIMLTVNQDNQANCIAKRFELERQAQASR